MSVLLGCTYLSCPTLRSGRLHLFDIVARHGLHFDNSRQRGVVFHMVSCLTELGRIGLTAVGNTPQDACGSYQNAERVLLAEAEQALREGAVVD